MGKRRTVINYAIVFIMLFTTMFANGDIRAAASGEAVKLFDFEDGATGLEFKQDSSTTNCTLANTTEKVFSGNHALKVVYQSSGNIDISVPNIGSINPGDTVTFHVYISDSSNVSIIMPYSMDKGWSWSNGWVNGSDLKVNEWNTINYKLDDSKTSPFNVIALRFMASNSGSLFIDDVAYATAGPIEGVTVTSDNGAATAIDIGLNATVTDNEISLKWNKVDGAASYTVKRSEVFGGPYAVLKADLTDTNYIDTGLNPGNYYYIVEVNKSDNTVVNSGQISSRILGPRQLQDLTMFSTKYDGWSGSGNGALETVNSTLPMDTTQKYNNLPSVRVNVMSKPDWMNSLLAPSGWCTFTLEQYYEHGSLEFNIKGENGGEDFSLGFRDSVKGRTPEEIESVKSLKALGVKVTKEWQHVSIPIKVLIDLNSGFSLKDVRVLALGLGSSSTFKCWINDMKIISPDDEKSYAAIKVNQLGYNTNSKKYALVTGFPDKLKAVEGTVFQVKDENGNTAFSGELKPVTELDAASGEKILKADFSTIKKPGIYYVSVPDCGIEDSLKFEVADNIYDNLLVDSSRYFYYQRQGMDLATQYAGIYARKNLHPEDSTVTLHSQQGKADAQIFDVSGGWYDAGDYGKYISAGATAVSDLLWTYEMFPGEFKDNQFNIPESGNGIADILDEAKYELDFFLKMQDVKTGGFYDYVWPQNDIGKARYIEDMAQGESDVKSTVNTADAAAILAHAYIVYKNIFPEAANKYLAAAKEGWKYLENNPDLIKTPSGPYYAENDKGERLWAAASLYRATGEAKYNDYFKAHYDETGFAKMFDEPQNAHGVNGMALIAYLNYMKSSSPDENVTKWFKNKFNNWSQEQLKRSGKGSWGNTLRDTDYYWGSNMPALETSLVLYAGNSLLGQDQMRATEAALGNLNYVLGTNPLRFSYVSGYGEDCEKNVFSGIWSSDNIDSIPKGYMAGGANGYEGKMISRFAAKCHLDSNGEWTTNEHTIYWNSALVFSAALAKHSAASDK